MEIGNLIGKIRGGEKDKPKPFLAVELTDEIVQAAVWHVEEGKTEIIAIGTPVEWDGDKAEAGELVTAADATISNATEGLAEEIGEVIFGLAGSWAGEGGILPEKLKLLKKLSQELELKPLGFVVINDSLLRYLKMQEGTPTTSILVQVATDTVTVSLVRLGKLEGSEIMGRSDDISADVEEGLSRFQAGGELPSRILVYNSMHSLEEEVQNLISYDWKSKFNFLHIPKIESLPKDVLIRSIAVAGGSEVAKAIGFEIAEPKEQPETNKESNVVPTDSELLGAEDFGFVPEKKTRPSAPAPSRVVLEKDEEVEPKKSFKMPKITVPNLPKFKFKLKLPPLGKPSVILGVAALFILALGASAIWLLPKAAVTLYVEPKDLEENVALTLSASATAIDESNSIVPARAVEKEVEGEETVTTTGKKTIGDPAKGEVTIYNRTSVSKTFPKDTVLTAKSLKFTLTESVTVASKSAGSDYVDVPGKAVGKVAARAIGEEGNLPSGTEFTLESFAKDTYVAKNDKALSGGTSEEVQVVDKTDAASLKAKLLSRLKEEGRDQVIAELGDGIGVYVMEKGTEIIKETYSAEVGQEATALTGSLEVKVKGVSYQTRDVENLMAQELAKAIPPGYERTIDPPTVELGEVKSETKDGVEVQAKIVVKLLPTIDRTVIQKSLRGVSASEINSSLSGVIGFKTADVVITPAWLPPRFKRMPRNPENISVSVVASPI